MRPSDYPDVFGFGDPTPGDTYEVRSLGRRWGSVADEAEFAEGRLRGLLGDDAVATWIGKAGEAFGSHSSELPDQLAKAKNSYRMASDTLGWWADQLDTHQTKADNALQQGRDAKADLVAAQSQLSHATSSATSAGNDSSLTYTGDPASDLAPTAAQVSAARQRLASAQQAASTAQRMVDNAQARLDAARRLASDAGHLREDDGRTAAGRIHDASDAGIKERSRWQKFKDGVAAAWKVIVTIAKVVVAVLGVVALIIGGPIAWVVFAAALIVLADTLIKYFKGEASLLDVGLAILSCIPGTKGLTTLKELSAAFKAGGLLGAGGHLLGALKLTVVNLAASANALRKGLVPGIKMAVKILGGEGALAFPQLRTTIREIAGIFKVGDVNSPLRAVDKARRWQGSGAFPGVDDYSLKILDDVHLEAGFPHLGSYSTDAGVAASHGNEASGVWEGLQVGRSENPNYSAYRGSMVELHVVHPTMAGSGPTLANPQYGVGGDTQYFFDIPDAISKGHVQVMGHDGHPIHIPEGTPPGDINQILNDALGGKGTIELHGANHPNTDLPSQETVKGEGRPPVTHHDADSLAGKPGPMQVLAGLGFGTQGGR